MDRQLKAISNKIAEIENTRDVDSIETADGTKVWNLVRVCLNIYMANEALIVHENERKGNKLLFVLKDRIQIASVPKARICTFSDTTSRKYFGGTYYDIYMDPLSEIFDDFAVFEWPTVQCFRYRNVFSKQYRRLHIPLIVVIGKVLKVKPIIKNEELLDNIINSFGARFDVDTNKLTAHVYEAIKFLIQFKKYVKSILKKANPSIVFVRCGYGRFQMAVNQACRELDIPVVELQHGVIFNYHPGYTKQTKSDNRDCLPDYLFTWGEVSSAIVKKGYLFEKKNIISVGFPYIEKVSAKTEQPSNDVLEFIKRHRINILVSGQMHVADKFEKFIGAAANMDKTIGILYKPHPRDINEYTFSQKNVFLVNKEANIYSIFPCIDIHSAVSSTTLFEALYFGKPNLLLPFDSVSSDFVDNKTIFLAGTPELFITRANEIYNNYENIKCESTKFIKPNALENIKEAIEIVQKR